jgi:uncharacterized protein with PIN domain
MDDNPVKFHLDQHVPNAVAYGLRQLGVDVTTTHEAGLQDSDDRDHMAYAVANGRVIITHDAGFLQRHAAGEDHAGIGYCPQSKYRRNPGALIRATHNLFVRKSAEEMVRQLEYL